MNRSGSTVISPARPDPAGFRGADVLRQPTGSLNLAQRAALAELTSLVRLVHDLVVTFTERYAVFPEEIAGAQRREAALLHTMLDRYGLSDSDTAHLIGRFPDIAMQTEYDRLSAQGRSSRSAAVTVVMETLHRVLGMLDAALPRMHAPDVHLAYLELYAATLHQEQAMRAWRKR